MKKTFLVPLIAALVMFTTAADAGSIGRGSVSFSRGSISSPSRSIGMSRPSISRPAPAPSYAPPRPTTSPNVAPPPPVAHAPTAVAGGSGFLSSAAGGFAGSALGNLMTQNHGGGHTTVVTGGGGGGAVGATVAPAYAYGDGVVSSGSQVVVAQSASNPGASFARFLWNVLISVVLICLIGFVIWLAYTYIKSEREAAKTNEADPNYLPFSPTDKFIKIQKAYAARDTAALGTLLGPDLFAQVEDDLPPEGSEYSLHNITYEVMEVDQFTITIWFKADDKSDGAKTNELWHFRRIGAAWLLNGIEPFPQA